MVVLISDLLDDPEAVIRGLKHFQYRGSDVLVFHVLDPDELEFPFDRRHAVRGSRNRRRGDGGAGAVRDHYLQADVRPHRSLSPRAWRRRHRLSAAQHKAAARDGAAGVSVHAIEDGVMTFLSPLFLVGAAAAAVPIVLHLLRRRPEQRVRFAAVMFLKGAPVEHTSRRRLREWLLLALRVTALVLLALAFARPFFRTASAAARSARRSSLLDTSFSMSAPGRFDRAKSLAKDAVRNATSGDDVALVTFSDQAAVVVRPTPDRGAVAAAIDAAASGFGATRYRGRLERRGIARRRPARRDRRGDRSAGERLGCGRARIGARGDSRRDSRCRRPAGESGHHQRFASIRTA